MTKGKWRVYSTPIDWEEFDIDVVEDELGEGEEPYVIFDEELFRVRFADGRQVLFPMANVCKLTWVPEEDE